MIKKILRIFSVVFLVGSLAACGFHLRSANELPPELRHLYLDTPNPNGPFSAQLAQLLKGMCAEILPNAQSAPLTLHIEQAAFVANQPNVISSSVVTTYTYNYNVQFSIENKLGKTVVPTTGLSVAQSIYAAPNQMLTGTATSARVENSLRTQVLQLLVTQLTTTRIRTLLAHSAS